MELSVLLPTYHNRPILWLALEGLCRQNQSPPWELIIFECEHDSGLSYVKQYSKRLSAAGCRKITYLNNETRLPLSLKWREMVKHASGRYVALQGSDDYPHPERNQLAVEIGADWYDCGYYYQYHVRIKKLIQYYTVKKKSHKTGFNMCIKTELLKDLPPDVLYKNIDGWLFRNASPSAIVQDERIFAGVSTTGLNTISTQRDDYFRKPTAPFRETAETIDTIGLPADVVNRLINI